MKFSLGALLAANACKITFYQVDSRNESGARYRVQIKASGVPDMWKALDDTCNIYRSAVRGRQVINPQCYGVSEGGFAWADTSVANGPDGLRIHNDLWDSVVAELQRNSNYGPNCAYEQHSTW